MMTDPSARPLAAEPPNTERMMASIANESAAPAFGRMSPESVREATGRDAEEWMRVLDAAGAAAWPHGQTVAWLEQAHPEVSSWWRQSITVAYERARGKRAVGQTAGGFAVGVQRSVAASAAEAWALVAGRPALWLGEGAPAALKAGQRFTVGPADGAPGARAEVRTMKPGERLRIAWHADGWPAPATLLLTLLASGPGKTAINVQLEKLPDAPAREVMRTRWRAALDRLAAALG